MAWSTELRCPGRTAAPARPRWWWIRDFDLAAFRADVALRLPAYARPVFLRLRPHIESTGTFKPRKEELVQAGFDPARIADPLFVDDMRRQAYVPVDAQLFAQITAGSFRI